MAKSISADKRENEKKRLARRAEKQKKKEEKKLSNKASSFEDMIAYVDENGMITSTPPAENTPKEEIKLEEIVISTPKKDKEEPVIRRGRIEFFNESKGFGFIKDLSGVEKYFFHINNVLTDITEGNIVTFDLERGLKGMNAVNVALEVEKAKKKKEDKETLNSRPLKSAHLRNIVRKQYPADFFNKPQKSPHGSFEVVCGGS